MPGKLNLINNKFGRLKVLEDTGKRTNSKKILYKCQCECGKIVEIERGSLTNGDTKSCGCLKTEKTTKHGSSKTKLYRIWADMLSRCRSKTCVNYKYYGGKGVKVCSDWIDFTNFKDWSLKNGYIRGLSIDRIDPEGNYEPSNCRWATRKQQDRNKRGSLFVMINGESINLKEVSERYGLSYTMLKHRYNTGVRGERIISPNQRGRKFE